MTIPQSDWTPTVTLNPDDHPIAFYYECIEPGHYEWRVQVNDKLAIDRNILKHLILDLNQWSAQWLYINHPRAIAPADEAAASLLAAIQAAQEHTQKLLADYLLWIAKVTEQENTE